MRTDWLTLLLIIIAIAAIPGGVMIASYFNDGRWMIVSAIGVIFFLAG